MSDKKQELMQAHSSMQKARSAYYEAVRAALKFHSLREVAGWLGHKTTSEVRRIRDSDGQ